MHIIAKMFIFYVKDMTVRKMAVKWSRLGHVAKQTDNNMFI